MSEKLDPNLQQHHTFGDSRAAVRLKSEIDAGARYKSAVRLLNKNSELLNAIAETELDLEIKQKLIQLSMKDCRDKIESCSSDLIVKSLVNNVLTAKYRKLLRNLKLSHAIALHE